jgi:hypothetical protein
MPNLTINGHQFEVPEGLLSRYGVGYTLATEGEAHALQQVFTENLRNNFAPKVKAKLNGSEELTPEDQAALQAEFDAYASKYEFGVRGAGGGPRQVIDKTEKEVRAMAAAAITTKYKAMHGEKPPKDYLNETVNALLERGGETVEIWFKEARDLLKRKERMHERAAASLEGMGIS